MPSDLPTVAPAPVAGLHTRKIAFALGFLVAMGALVAIASQFPGLTSA